MAETSTTIVRSIAWGSLNHAKSLADSQDFKGQVHHQLYIKRAAKQDLHMYCALSSSGYSILLTYTSQELSFCSVQAFITWLLFLFTGRNCAKCGSFWPIVCPIHGRLQEHPIVEPDTCNHEYAQSLWNHVRQVTSGTYLDYRLIYTGLKIGK